MLYTEDKRTLNRVLRDFNRAYEGFGLAINVKKTESISKLSRTAQIKIANEEIEQVTFF